MRLHEATFRQRPIKIVTRIEALRNHPEMGRIVPAFEQLFLRELIRARSYRLSARSEARADRAGRAQRAPARTAGRTCALSAADDGLLHVIIGVMALAVAGRIITV